MIDDALYLVAGGFVLAVSILVVVLASGILSDVSDGLPLSAADNATMSSMWSRLPTAFDNAVGFAIIGLMAASLVMLYYIAISPALFFVIVIMMGLVNIIAGVLSNAWSDIVGSTALSAVVGSVPKTAFIMEHFVAFTVMYLVLAAIVFFAKPAQVGGA